MIKTNKNKKNNILKKTFLDSFVALLLFSFETIIPANQLQQ